jgi:hypothetical protein
MPRNAARSFQDPAAFESCAGRNPVAEIKEELDG